MLVRGPVLWFSLVALVSLVACRQEPSYPQRPMPDGLQQSGEALAAGRQLFLAKCASCHGRSGEGRSDRAVFFEPPAPDFSEHRYREVDPAYLYWRIELGKTIEPYRSNGSVMPAWGAHFSAEETWQLVAYLISRSE